jgi:hypothetical protein
LIDSTPSPGPQRRSRPGGLTVLAVVMFVAAAAVVFVHFYREGNRDDVTNARAGTCVAEDDVREPPYRIVPCPQPEAEHVVLAVVGDVRQCREVAGASLVFTLGEKKALCLGEKGADPATAINVAKEGDCIALTFPPIGGEVPRRLDCSDPAANLRVLKRLTATSKFEDSCKEVPGYVRSYSWDWRDLNPRFPIPDATIDVTLCFGLKEEPKPTPPPGPDDAGSPCRLVTAEEMAAAVSTAAGRRYSVGSRELKSTANTNDACVYRFTTGKDHIEMWVRRPYRSTPGTGDETLTVGGVPAIYGPGEGNRVLAVYHPNANVTILVRIAAAGDSLSKKIAIAIFTVAQPRLG